MSKIDCRATSKTGNPCKASAWANGYCIAHQPEEVRKKAGHKSGTREGGGQRDPLRVPELAKRIVEANAAAILYPYVRAMGLKLMRHKLTGEIVAVPDPRGRAKLYGTSKDGRIVMSNYEDLAAMVAVAEKLIDRVYGRPKQSLTVAGDGDGSPVTVAVAGDKGRASEVAQILAMTGAIRNPASNN
jgi:hypothetical protein